ncbi:MAG: TetR/AcrR family transcriptional regulator [Chloroflexi bacterium]|nr:TetR/AcrR family transcriptional regulator [Chloroflexota bacterium]
MAQKEDRRVRRTKKLLKGALIELILEKGYDAITVADILDRADVGRSTFYAHYNSKDDLLVGDAPFVQIDFEDMQDENDNEIIPSFLEMFRHVQEQSHLFRALMGGEGINLVQRIVLTHLRAAFEAHFNRMEADGRPLALPAPVLTYFLTGGFMSLLAWWLDAGMPYSPEEMNEMYMQMARGTAVYGKMVKENTFD